MRIQRGSTADLRPTVPGVLFSGRLHFLPLELEVDCLSVGKSASSRLALKAKDISEVRAGSAQPSSSQRGQGPGASQRIIFMWTKVAHA